MFRESNFLLIPTHFYEKTLQKLYAANNDKLQVKYKLSNASICNKGKCFKNSFILTKDINEDIILGTPFLTQIYPFEVSSKGIKTKDILFEFIKPLKNKEIRTVKD